MVEGIGSNVTNIMVVAKDFAGLILRPGQVFAAHVVSQAQEQGQYLLKIGESYLPVRSEKPLEIGQAIRLHVLGFQGEDLLVEKLPWLGEQDEKTKAFSNLLKKYGIKGKKEIVLLKEALSKLPVEENTAVRYLLDPNLFTALLLPGEKREDVYDELEINRFKGTLAQDNVWEVNLALLLASLGKIEVKIKMQGGNLYAQIWAEVLTTEKLLHDKKKDLEKFCPSVQILSAKDGPLLIDNYIENIDLLV